MKPRHPKSRVVLRPICFAIGHRWDRRAHEFGYHDCTRCGLVEQYLYEERPFYLYGWLADLPANLKRPRPYKIKWTLRCSATPASEDARRDRES